MVELHEIFMRMISTFIKVVACDLRKKRVLKSKAAMNEIVQR